MKKIHFLKTVLSVAIAAFVGANVSGQTTFVNDNYVQYDSTAAAPSDSDYVTVGKAIGYYAKPDPVFHPNYTQAGTWALTTDFTWIWTNPIHASGAEIAETTPGAANYAQFIFPVEGVYVVQAQEQAPTAFGGCPGTKSSVWIHAVPVPTGTMSITPDDGDWQELVAADPTAYQKCSTTTSTEIETVTVSFFEKVPFDIASYAFMVTEEIDLINGAGTVIVDGTETVIENFDLLSKVKDGDITGDNAAGLADANFTNTGHNFYYTFSTDALRVQTNAGQNYRTRYTYRVRRAGAAGTSTVSADNDFISAISQKSDFVDGTLDYYAFTNNDVTYIVNPAPVTGPIYHIPNTFAY